MCLDQPSMVSEARSQRGDDTARSRASRPFATASARGYLELLLQERATGHVRQVVV